MTDLVKLGWENVEGQKTLYGHTLPWELRATVEHTGNGIDCTIQPDRLHVSISKAVGDDEGKFEWLVEYFQEYYNSDDGYEEDSGYFSVDGGIAETVEAAKQAAEEAVARINAEEWRPE